MPSEIRLDGLDHAALVVRDIPASIAWYERVLGLQRRFADAWGDVPAMLAAPGGNCSGLALFPLDGTEAERRPNRWRALVVDHIAFRVDRANFEVAQRRLRELGIAFGFEDHGVCHSSYFDDPDGHRLELTTYEVGT